MKVYVKKSKINGKGLFAKENIKKGSRVGIVAGLIIPDNENSYKKYNINYLHPINYNYVIVNQNITRYINHSCEPNCGLRNGIEIIALRNIKKDEEITIDYDTLEYDWKMKCNCKSKNCRKVIKGYKYLSEKLKNKYKGFIS
ncbi:MAG: SET domain-containing protein-lysine N-methyltransferase, partial [Candidatus Pacearchaeota archaeon]|nr:SET domain-containing protein-lysine N-methyltransferase [Candidatus Pacearchaeota archaeon]